MEDFLQTYGPLIVYAIFLAGSFFEGESVILLISALAYKYDELSIGTLIMLAFLGSMSADQLLFFIGRRYGPSIIERRPRMREASKRVFYHLHRHSTLFIIGFRFIYGIRTVSPIVIGASGVDVKRFAILNFFAAFLWAVLSCSAGYLIGYFLADSVEEIIKNIGEYQKIIAISLVFTVFILSMYYFIRKKR